MDFSTLMMDSETFLAGAGKIMPVLAMFFAFPNLASSEVIRWMPGGAYLKGFSMWSGGGVNYCISINGTIASDGDPTTQTPGVIWKASSTLPGIYVFPNDGLIVEKDEVVYISKNQVGSIPNTIYYSGIDLGPT